jgi:hypothetical protein
LNAAIVRDNSGLAKWLRAPAIGLLLWAGMSAMHAQPTWLPPVAAILVGALALATPEVAVILAILALCVPVLAANAIVGIAMAIVLFSAEHFFGRGGGTVFILTGLAIVGAFFGPAWAAAALAGYLLGASEGAIAAAAACSMIELLGVLTAKLAIGVVPTGGSGRAAVDFSHMPGTLLSPEWIGPAFKSVSPAGLNTLGAVFAHVQHPLALMLQLVGWGVAAVVAGTLLARMPGKGLWAGLGAISAGVAVAWGADGFIRLVVGVSGSPAASTAVLASSLVVAWIVVGVRETVFTPASVPGGDAPSAQQPSAGLAAAHPEPTKTAQQPPAADSAEQETR